MHARVRERLMIQRNSQSDEGLLHEQGKNLWVRGRLSKQNMMSEENYE